MKKLFYLLAVTLVLMSCGPNEPRKLNRRIIDLEIDQKEWTYSDVANNNYFTARFKMDEITKDVYDNATITVYREWNTGSSRATQMQLPYVRQVEEYVEDAENPDNSAWVFFTETVDYEYGIGWMDFTYRVSDFLYEINYYEPETMHFRVVILW